MVAVCYSVVAVFLNTATTRQHMRQQTSKDSIKLFFEYQFLFLDSSTIVMIIVINMNIAHLELFLFCIENMPDDKYSTAEFHLCI